MTVFTLMIWAGGVFAMPDQKLGIQRRLMWPAELGERLAAWSWDAKP